MSEIVTFTNKETKKDISIDLKTKFVIVYGKNGSGKTTFSRSSCFENGFVFNTDFIHKNIYVESDNGATESAENKKQFSSLWVCEEVVKKKQEISKLKNISKNIDESYDKLISKIKGEFSEKRVAYDIFYIEKIIDFKKASVPINNDWSEYIKTHKRNYEIKSSIKDQKEFETKLAQLNDNGLLLQFIGLLKKDKFLTSLILDKKCDFLYKLTESIDNYNNSLDELKKCEAAFSM